jgi:hypothetical protein
MKKFILIILTTLNLTLHGQNNDTWVSFWNKDSTLVGYKDNQGKIRIEPKYSIFSSANKLDHMMAVTEEKNGKMESFYLTKMGRIIGVDSIYFFDNRFDCENDGFIRFKVRSTEKVGLFNKKGNIVIPPIYNELSNVRNGMIVALKDAEKKQLNGGEHFSWEKGREILLDTNHVILLDSFSFENKFNLYSIKKTQTIPDEWIRKSFIARDGTYLSFIDFEKEFKEWLLNDLLNNLTSKKLMDASYPTITWENKNGWVKSRKKKFILENFGIIKNKLSEILNKDAEYFISMGGLNSFLFDGKEFEPYYNNCGDAKEWKYPTMELVISSKLKKDHTQNHFEFLRTETGYKLISLTIRSKFVNLK